MSRAPSILARNKPCRELHKAWIANARVAREAQNTVGGSKENYRGNTNQSDQSRREFKSICPMKGIVVFVCAIIDQSGKECESI
jgi:hypothetical protein